MWTAATIAVIVVIVALNWQWFTFAAAVVLAERRPTLLVDAQWNEPASAHAFSNRFRAGTNEAALLAWLQSNKFTIDRGAHHATRLVQSLPCNEFIEVEWSRRDGDKLGGAEARVSKAGCL